MEGERERITNDNGSLHVGSELKMKDPRGLTRERSSETVTPRTVCQTVGGVVPLVLVVLSIGMMSFAPRGSSLSLFHSASEARLFYQSNHLTFSYNQPIVLVESECLKCDDLTKSLRKLQIPFVEHNIERNPGALALREQVSRVSGSKTLPMIVLGDQMITPAPYSLKVALRQLRRSPP